MIMSMIVGMNKWNVCQLLYWQTWLLWAHVLRFNHLKYKPKYFINFNFWSQYQLKKKKKCNRQSCCKVYISVCKNKNILQILFTHWAFYLFYFVSFIFIFFPFFRPHTIQKVLFLTHHFLHQKCQVFRNILNINLKWK